jgi:hypothetical protein
MTSRFIAAAMFACMLPLCSSSAGPVSLKAGQVEALRKLIAQDPEAASLYSKLHKVADEALNDTPQPVPVIVSEGKLDSDPDKIRSRAAHNDLNKAYALAWVWLIDQKDNYAAKGIDFILSWARINHPDGDPINETQLEPLIVAYDILRSRFAPRDRDFVDSWLANRALMLWNDPRHHIGNWQSHRLKIVGLIAAVLNDEALWQKVAEGFKEQIGNSFLPDGESMDFQLRDAMHYHLYSVSPLLALACVAHERSQDWYNYRGTSGTSLKGTIDFIKPYASKEKEHMEFANSKVKFDKTRANAGQAEYIPHPWKTCDAAPVFSQASCVDPEAEKWALKTSCEAPHERFADWQGVLNSVRQ